MSDLKPCPDGHLTVSTAEWPVSDEHHIPWRWYARCTCCGWRGPSGRTEPEAIAAWNTRADTTKDADIARLRDYLGSIRDYAPEVTHGWALAIRTFARQALASGQIETSGFADCEGGHDA